MSDKTNDNSALWWAAVILGFAPAALLLVLRSGNSSGDLLIGATLISIICCFGSSFILFRRGSGLAVVGGVLFLILNGAIALFLGCSAILSGAL